MARQGVVPTALKCQHLSCSVARIHYLFWVRQPENIPLVETGDSKPGSSAGCMPFVYTPVNLLQHEARVQVSVGLIASGETDTRLVLSREEDELWAVLMRRAASSAVTSRKILTAKERLILPSYIVMLMSSPQSWRFSC